MKTFLLFGVLQLATANFISDRVTKVLVVYRHGDRAPVVDSYPTDPNRNYQWTDGKGNITTLGRTQGLALGTTLRRRYNGFLNVNDVTEAFARSSAVSRCIFTTICVLTGIYEPNETDTCYKDTGFTPGPVYTVEPGKNDQMLYVSPYCPRNDLEIAKILSSPAFANFVKINQDLFTQIQNLSGFANLKNPISFLGLYDNIIVEKAHNLSQPEWVDQMFPEIQKLGAALYDFASYTDLAAKLQAGVLLNDIITQMTKPVPNKKLYLYGTHDTNVVPAMKLLRVFNGLPPPYTAAIIIELHEQRQLLFRTIQCVQIFYRNSTTSESAFKMNIQDCPEDCCPLEKFIQLTQKNAITDPEKECRLLDPSGRR